MNMRKEQIEKVEDFVRVRKDRVKDLKRKFRDLERRETERLTGTHNTRSYLKSKAKIRQEVEHEQRTPPKK